MSSAQVVIATGAFRRKLRVWYAANARALPWRVRPSVYGTVVSEFMCQQTQVDTVTPYFERWLRRWPDFEKLAAADEASVMKAWEGLGYYRRARNLYALAKLVATMPEPPRTAGAWLELPGIGPYTAAAIASISAGEPVAVVDGNVVRVLARVAGDERRFKSGGDAVKAFGRLAQELLDPDFPGDHNQAMMELGATVCARSAPRCSGCPVRTDCAAAKQGIADELPRFAPKVSKKFFLNRLLVVDPATGALLLRRYGPNSPTLAGLCELPESTGLADSPESGEIVAVKKRVIANRHYTETIRRLSPTRAFIKRAAADAELLWISPRELRETALSGPHRKWLEALVAGSEE